MTNWGEKCQERKIQFSSNYLLTELNTHRQLKGLSHHENIVLFQLSADIIEYSMIVKGSVSLRKLSFLSNIC